MGLITAPLRLGISIVRVGTRAATLPARAGLYMTIVLYEELLDVAERGGLMEPPDPPASTVRSRERPRRRRAA
jgi:hypothetical protein